MKKGLLALLLMSVNVLHAQVVRYRMDTATGRPAPLHVRAASTFFKQPQGLFLGADGSLYMTEVNGGLVKKIARGTSLVSIVAGDIYATSSGDGGPALSARLNTPRSVALDSAGNMFIGEWGGCAIRRVDAVTQIITTYAGQIGQCGYGGDDGIATAALLNLPRGIALDPAGNLYIAESARVRKVDVITQVITTFAGTGIPGNTGDGGPATDARISALGLAFDIGGNAYVSGTAWIRKIDSTGTISTYAGTGVVTYNGEGLPATASNIGFVKYMQFDSSGNLFFSDETNARVRKVDGATSLVTTVAGNGVTGYSGDGGPATEAALNTPGGVAVDSAGNVYVVDFFNNNIRKITGGLISTYGGSVGPENVDPTRGFVVSPSDVAIDASGALYMTDTLNGRIRRVDANFTAINTIAGLGHNSSGGDGGPALSAGFFFPCSLALDPAGNLYIGDNNFVVRRVDAVTGLVSTVAGISGSFGYSGDNGPATAAMLSNPCSLAFDPSATTLYIADANNSVIRAVTNGQITTVAGNYALGPGFSGDDGAATSAQLNGPQAIAVDSSGNLFIADSGNNRVRMVRASDQVIVTVAGNGIQGYSGDGGAATAASLSLPWGIRVDSAGNLFISEFGNNVIRMVSGGVISTIAGDGTPGYSGDRRLATSGQLFLPGGMAIDPTGNIYVAESGNNVVRRLSPTRR